MRVDKERVEMKCELRKSRSRKRESREGVRVEKERVEKECELRRSASRD